MSWKPSLWATLETWESRAVPTHHFYFLVLLKRVTTQMSSEQLPQALHGSLSYCTGAPSPSTSPRAGIELYHTIQANPTPLTAPWLNVSGELGLAVALGLGRNNLQVLYEAELYLLLLLLYSLLEQVSQSTVTSVGKEGKSWWQVGYVPSTSNANSWKMDCFKPGSL